MRLCLTYFPLFLLTLTLTFYVKSTVIVEEHTDYELNLKRKKSPKIMMKCYKVLKLGDFEIQREIEFRKYSKYPKSHGRIPVSDKKNYR